MKKKNIKDSQMRIIFVLVFIIIVGAAIYFFIPKNSNTVKYNDVTFNKKQVGSLLFYTAQIPLYDSSRKLIKTFSIDFNNNPNTLSDIPVQIPEDQIKFLLDRKTYISFNITACKDNAVAGGNLGIFLHGFGIDYKAALDNSSINTTDIPYVNCNTNPLNTVIYITNSNETKISKPQVNCYKLEFKDCEIVRATERFELAMLEQYFSKF